MTKGKLQLIEEKLAKIETYEDGYDWANNFGSDLIEELEKAWSKLAAAERVVAISRVCRDKKVYTDRCAEENWLGEALEAYDKVVKNG